MGHPPKAVRAERPDSAYYWTNWCEHCAVSLIRLVQPASSVTGQRLTARKKGLYGHARLLEIGEMVDPLDSAALSHLLTSE
jgi:hypothetical protein